MGADHGFEDVFENERSAIVERRRNVGPMRDDGFREIKPAELHEDAPEEVLEPGLIGLALSGGGIHSATFALGLLQALAKKDLLKYFDYLSTVSGGGYIGASVTWLLRAGNRSAGYGLEGADFPFGTAAPRDRQDPAHWTGMLRYLRERGKYLIPGRGITLVSTIAVLVRGILLNLLVWLPILTAVFLVLLVEFKSPALKLILKDVPGLSFEKFNYFDLSWVLGVVAFLVFVAICVVYSLFTFVSRRRWPKRPKWLARYSLRRWFESRVKWLLPASAILVVLGTLPMVVQELDFEHGSSGIYAGSSGIGALILGFVSAVWTFVRSERNLPIGIRAPLGAALFFYGVAVLTGAAAIFLSRQGASDGFWMAVFWAVLTIAVMTAVFVNSNYISLHRFYRDRLMEAFMPDQANIDSNTTGAAKEADGGRLSDMWNPGAAAGDCGSPYHILNTNLVLADSDVRKYHVRGGDNFFLSPLYCGGNVAGYTPTDEFMGDGMTLPTAVAISGASANPDTAVGGTGPTRNKLVSWLLALLNIRLGYWIQNPLRLRGATGLLRAFYLFPANHIVSLLYEVWPRGFNEKRFWLQISDGGHFENLALYELVRRRARLIVVSDAGADPKFAFGDLRNAVLRVGQDFRAKITFGRPFWATPPGTTPDRNLLSSMIPAAGRPAGFPAGVDVAERGFVVGTIEYDTKPGAQKECGVIVYVKTTTVDGLSLETRGYKGQHRDFPDQSTADQFFDEQQFEAYRELGFKIGTEMIAGTRLADLIGTVR